MKDKGFEQALCSGSPLLLNYFPCSQSLPNFDAKALKLPKQNQFESHQLPHLHSIEHEHPRSNHANRLSSSTSAMISPSPSFTSHSYNPNTIVGNPCLPPNISSPSLFSPAPPCKISARKRPKSSPFKTSKKRMKTTSGETQSLAKLMPWGSKKMNMETTLSEAYKYIKFLQVQIRVLQSMPCQSLMLPKLDSGSGSGGASSGLGGLEKLNRQQLLQVVLNSQVVQKVLSSKESCVYSLEQVLLLKNGLI